MSDQSMPPPHRGIKGWYAVQLRPWRVGLEGPSPTEAQVNLRGEEVALYYDAGQKKWSYSGPGAAQREERPAPQVGEIWVFELDERVSGPHKIVPRLGPAQRAMRKTEQGWERASGGATKPPPRAKGRR